MKILLKYIYPVFFIIALSSCQEGVDSDNRAPVIGDYVFSVLESIPDDEVIATLGASDPNLYDDLVAETLEYSILENSGDLFEITPTGQLSLASGAVLSTSNPTHSLVVEVEDSAGNTDTGTINIAVAENQAPIVEGAVFAKGENITDDVVIGVVSGIDPNTGLDIIFSITQNSNDLFEITPEGELSLAPGQMLDFQTASEHNITVAASDGSLEGTAEVIIIVLDPTDFVLRIETSVPDKLITLNTQTVGEFEVDWGDGTITNETENPVHSYAQPGSYLIKIKATIFPQFRLGGTTDDLLPNQLVAFVQWGDHQWTNVNQLFMNCFNMEYEAVDLPDFSALAALPNLFRGCTSMTGNATMGDWDTSNITSAVRTFFGASQFNQDLSRWEVTNVVNANFFGDGSGLTEENLPNFP